MPQILLLLSVVGVGVLHTIVPDHWVPISVLAHQKKWSRAETIRAAMQAGTGHVLSTLAIALLIWVVGVAFAMQFGRWIDIISSLALISFGLWIALSSLSEINAEHGHSHSHHDHVHAEGDEHHHDRNQNGNRTALLLIVGSSPMVEGIPAFFAASKYGIGLVISMSVLFAVSTIATYVVTCVVFADLLQKTSLVAFEKYGEVLSGGFIALIGFVFLFV